jgi:putative peptidoglycan lipid II flippase
VQQRDESTRLAEAGTPPSDDPERKSFGDREREKLTGRASIVGAGTLLSRVFGLVRDQVLTAVFTPAMTDAFIVAFKLPNMLRRILGEGLVQSAVLPVLTETREKYGDDHAREFFRAFRGLSWTVLLCVSVAGVVAAPWLVDVFAPGYLDRPEQHARTVSLVRWIFPYIFFMGTATLGMAALNSYRRFVVTSFAPTLLNVSMIASAVALPTWFRSMGIDPIMALVPGVLLGGLLQVLAQWPSLRAIGYLRVPRISLAHPAVKQALGRMGPTLFGSGVYWIDVLISTVFLSELPTGSQSYFNWAMRLCDVPQGVFALALSTAALPTLSSLFARGEHEEVSRTFTYGMKLALFVAIPATLLFVSAATPLIVALFERGEFGPSAATQTAHALMAQGLGIWAVAANRQLVTVFYAAGDTRTPAMVAVVNLTVFVGTSLALMGPLGHVGVGLAVSAASITQMVFLWVIVNRKHVVAPARSLLPSVGKTLIASIAAVAVGWIVAQLTDPLLGGSVFVRFVPGVLITLAFGVTFLVAAWLLRSDEFIIFRDAITRRFGSGGKR